MPVKLTESTMNLSIAALVILAVAVTTYTFVVKPQLVQYEFTKQELEDLRTQHRFAVSALDSMGNLATRDISLLLDTLPVQRPPGTNPQQFALASMQIQLNRITKMLEEQKAQQAQMAESPRETYNLVRDATLDLAIRNLSDRINAIEKKQLTKWDVAVVILQLMAGLGIVIGGVTYFARHVRKE